jgi:NIPSNAP
VVSESNRQLAYMLACDNLAEHQKRWSAFVSDPDWIATAAETEKNGQLAKNINQLMPTALPAAN